MLWTPNTFPEHLRHRREVLDWTQEEAAQAIGIHPSNYSDWERGVVREPQMALWPGILRFLGYDPICPKPNSLAEEIGYLGRHLGLSREALGKLLRVSGRTVYEWEQGGLTPSVRHHNKLYELLKLLPVPST